MAPQYRTFTRTLTTLAGAVTALWLVGMAVIAVSGLREGEIAADVALVLGSEVDRNGEPSPRLKARLDRAVTLFRDGNVPRMVVSGARGESGFNEGAVMMAYLVSQGIPTAAITVDSEGITTWASAVNLRKLEAGNEDESVVIVSQYFHLARASLALHKAGFKNVSSTYPRYWELRDLYSTAREVPAYLTYLFKQQME